jgi:hypothetical protein
MGEDGTDVLLPGIHALDRADDLRDRVLFRHAAIGADVERLVQEAGVDVQRQQDDARRRRPIAQGVRHVEAVAAGHVDIEDGHVRPDRRDRGQRLLAVARLGGDVQRGVGFEDLAQACPEDWMIVGDDDGDDRLHP